MKTLETVSRVKEVVGLIPAGGQATRIAPLPCSKELYPIGFRPVDEGRSTRPKVVCHYLLEKMRFAGVTKAYIVLREGKWDIPSYLNDGTMLDMNLAYLMMRLPFGAPYTIDQAYHFIQDALIVFGFPDVLFQSEDAFEQLLNRQATTKADVVLGLFPTDQPQKADMVEFNNDGWVRQIYIKPQHSNLRYAWMIAVWTPKFTRFMHEYLAEFQMMGKHGEELVAQRQELYVGNVIQAAIGQNFSVESIVFPDSVCLDIGTPENLAKAVYNSIAQEL